MERTCAVTIPSLLLTVLIAGCASSRQGPEPDRQTHWMQACDHDGDCGGMECVCGLCTLVCGEDSVCSEGIEAPSVCIPGSSPLAGALCREPTRRSVCLPECRDGQNCFPKPPPAIELNCAELAAGSQPPEIELVASGTFYDFTASRDAVYWANEDGIFTVDARGGRVSRMLRPESQVTGLAVDALGLVWSESEPQAVRLRSWPFDADGPSELDAISVIAGEPSIAIVTSSRDAFWVADGKLLRTPRGGGGTHTLAEAEGALLPNTFGVTSSHVYYVRSSDNWALHRVALSGSAREEQLVSGLVSGVAVSGDRVYYSKASAALSSIDVTDDEPAGIFQLLDDGRPERLMTTDDEPFGLLSDGQSLYWVEIDPSSENGVLESPLWRMAPHPAAEPALALVGDFFAVKGHAIAGAPGELYLLAMCATDAFPSGDQVLLRVSLGPLFR